ncbi:MAG: c-type cytochrome [Acetobacteraceae bacterium]
MTALPSPQPQTHRIQSRRANFFPARTLALLLAASVLAAVAPTYAATSAGRGVYTIAQAKAGKATFEQTCAICHGSHLQGKVGPALAGKQFLSVSEFQGLTAWFLYNFMSHHMPQNDPGSLSKKQYTDLMAFVLNANGYPAGNTELKPTKKVLQAIKIEPQAGQSSAGKPPQ